MNGILRFFILPFLWPKGAGPRYIQVTSCGNPVSRDLRQVATYHTSAPTATTKSILICSAHTHAHTQREIESEEYETEHE